MKTLFHYLLATSFVLAAAFAADGDKPAEPPPRVVVVGKGVTQGTVPYEEGMTVTKAILKSGGLAELAEARVFLIRNAKTTRVAFREILEKGKLEKDIRLQPWDIICVQ